MQTASRNTSSLGLTGEMAKTSPAFLLQINRKKINISVARMVSIP